MKIASLALAVSLCCAASGFAQQDHGGEHPTNAPEVHRIPQHGPEPYHGQDHPNRDEHRRFEDHPGHPNAPHVDNGSEWVGHNTGPRDPHYHLDRPWEFGHFHRAIGPEHRWRLAGGDPRHFFLGGGYWAVAPYDLGFADGWDWDAYDVVLYDDPDHQGWYLAYNVRLGTYVHVEYLGD